MQKIGIVLSGGGTRAIAHLGVLHALEERGIRPTVLAGTSAGALIAALYAAGLPPEQIRDLFRETAYFGISYFHVGRPGIFNMDALRAGLEKYLPFQQFEDLPHRLFVAATNLTEAKSEIISSGALIEPLLASSCVPGVFEPIVYRNSEWVDGGVLNNFPVEAILPHCDYIIGSHVNRQNDPMPTGRSLHKAHILERCFHLAIARSVYEKAHLCHVFLDHPGLSDFGIFESKDADKLFQLGHEFCTRSLPSTILSAE
ncbi:patatin-like phospholipase family protein [Puia dinghuensis]|uniref:PNPLA domain-containing protein n=1 Tax=Puia dinghuensis TaxID=1792502 RepID=A0A8J2XSZ6_9BACT|nr:patatin-like phospholipase family protein [Puia dinghuensis]GGA94785.1 hypothetical protein GCM10011511_17620 [Puia dinghuensis]